MTDIKFDRPFRFQRGSEGTLSNTVVEELLRDQRELLETAANKQLSKITENFGDVKKIEEDRDSYKEKVEKLTKENEDLTNTKSELEKSKEELSSKLTPILEKSNAEKAKILFKGLCVEGAEYDLAKQNNIDLSKLSVEDLNNEEQSSEIKATVEGLKKSFSQIEIPTYLKHVEGTNQPVQKSTSIVNEIENNDAPVQDDEISELDVDIEEVSNFNII